MQRVAMRLKLLQLLFAMICDVIREMEQILLVLLSIIVRMPNLLSASVFRRCYRFHLLVNMNVPESCK